MSGSEEDDMPLEELEEAERSLVVRLEKRRGQLKECLEEGWDATTFQKDIPRLEGLLLKAQARTNRKREALAAEQAAKEAKEREVDAEKLRMEKLRGVSATIRVAKCRAPLTS